MESLHHQQESAENSDEKKTVDTQMTTATAIELGIPSKFPPPDPVKCEFCETTLYFRGIYLWGSIICWSPRPDRCDCEKATSYWEAEDKRDAETKAAEEELNRRKIAKLRYEKTLGESGMKKRFLNRTFDTFIHDTAEKDRAWKIAKKYADTFLERAESGTGLYIEGTNGTGKTHLAAAISLQLMEDSRSVIFRTSHDLFGEIKRAWDDRSARSEYETMRAYKNCELLVIDDLGKERCTDWTVSALNDIVNDRYERMLPTIVTTNYGMDGLIKALKPDNHDDTKIKAIISRLKETSVTITMVWDDYRGNGGKK